MLSGFFAINGVKSMLEGKAYSAVDMLSPNIAVFIDRAIGYSDESKLSTLYTL